MEKLLARARAVLTTDNPDQFWLERTEEVIAAFTGNLIVTDGILKGVSISKDLERLVGPPVFLGRGGSRQNYTFYAGSAAASAQYALALRRPTQKQRERWLKSVKADLDVRDQADSTLQSNRAKNRAGYLAPHTRLLQAALEHYPGLSSDQILQELIEDVPEKILEMLEPVELATEKAIEATGGRIHFRFMTGAKQHSCSRRTALNILSACRKKSKASRKTGKP
jgi:hypothetical protein